MHHLEKEHVKKLVVSDLSEKKTRNGRHRVQSVTSLHFANFSVRTFEPYHAIDTAAVRTCAKFQIVRIHESEDREV